MWVGKGVAGGPTQLAGLDEGNVHPGTMWSGFSWQHLPARGGCGSSVEVGMASVLGRVRTLTSCQVGRWCSISKGRFPKMSENFSDRRMMSSQPWSDSQVHGFFHLLFSREMFPNHREKRVPVRGLSMPSMQTMPSEHPHGSCSEERSLYQGVRRHRSFVSQ